MSKKIWLGTLIVIFIVALAVVGFGCAADDDDNGDEVAEPIKVGVVQAMTGALEMYGTQATRGLELGLEYITGGTMEVEGRPIEFIIEDSEAAADVAVQKAIRLIEDEKIDILVGATSSAVSIALLPLAEEYKIPMIVHLSPADSITGEAWNPYVFRTARTSYMDAAAIGVALAEPGVKFAIFAPDYAFGHDAAEAITAVAEARGAEVILKEFVDFAATDHTASILRIMEAKPDYVAISWAGTTMPWTQMADMGMLEAGIKLTGNAGDIFMLRGMMDFIGMQGAGIYYYELPDNEMNDWLVDEHFKRFNEPPDLFTPAGFAASVAIVEALRKTGGNTDGDALVAAMKGMSFETPKGTMRFREEDHQALQVMYHIEWQAVEGKDYAVPVLIRELPANECAPPIMN